MFEQAFGYNPRLPGQFFEGCSLIEQGPTESQIEHFSSYLNSLPPRPVVQQKVRSFVNPKLKVSNFVYVRRGKTSSLQPHYSGPHKVLSKHDKHFVLLLNNKEDSVSIDRLKPVTDYPFDLVKLNSNFLLPTGELQCDTDPEQFGEQEQEEGILESSQDLRNGIEYQPIGVKSVQTRTRTGRLIKLPDRYKDYVA